MGSTVKSKKVGKHASNLNGKEIRLKSGIIKKKTLKTLGKSLKSLNKPLPQLVKAGNVSLKLSKGSPKERKNPMKVMVVTEEKSSKIKLSKSKGESSSKLSPGVNMSQDQITPIIEKQIAEAEKSQPGKKELKYIKQKATPKNSNKRYAKRPSSRPSGKEFVSMQGSRLAKKIEAQQMPSKPMKRVFDQPGLLPQKVEEAVKVIGKYLESKGVSGSNVNLFADEPQDIYLQITSLKIPKTSPREIRIALPHCPLLAAPDVCLFVADLQKGRRIDHDPTIEHYKQILEEKNVKGICEVISLRQLRTEFEPYEMKRALCNRFDLFLSDSKICQHAVHLLGKTFYQRRKIPVPVNLKKKDLKEHFEQAIRKTSFRVTPYGNVFTAKVGHTGISYEKLAENVMKVVQELPKVFPGGWENIGSLMLKGARSSAVPFYISIDRDDKVEVPVVKPRKPKAAVPCTDELDHYGTVIVYPSGRVQKSFLGEKSTEFKKTELAQNEAAEELNDLKGKLLKKSSEEITAYEHEFLKSLEISTEKNEKGKGNNFSNKSISRKKEKPLNPESKQIKRKTTSKSETAFGAQLARAMEHHIRTNTAVNTLESGSKNLNRTLSSKHEHSQDLDVQSQGKKARTKEKTKRQESKLPIICLKQDIQEK